MAMKQQRTIQEIMQETAPLVQAAWYAYVAMLRLPEPVRQYYHSELECLQNELAVVMETSPEKTKETAEAVATVLGHWTS